MALESGETFEHGPVDAPACDLFRQSIYWMLLARRSLTDAQLRDVDSFSSLWAASDPALLREAAGSESNAEKLKRGLVDQDFKSYAELPPDDQSALAQNLSRFATALADNVDGVLSRLERLWIRRILRMLLPLVAIVGIAVGVWALTQNLEDAHDIARGKPWVASSHWPEGGCHSPAQSCPESPNYFFCTNEEDNPWIVFDLGSVQPVSGIKVLNRPDEAPRAVPLVVEVSTDNQHWKEVARRTENFQTWKQSFPTAPARWVRLRVARKSFLHLLRVKIFS